MSQTLTQKAVPQSIVHAAAEWVGVLDSGAASDSERADFDRWYAAHPLHRTTFDRMRGFHDRLDRAGAPERGALHKLAARPAPRRAAAFGVLAIAVIGLSWAIWQSETVSDYFPDHKTQRGQQQTVHLASGSEIVLDTDTTVRVDEGKAEDTVRLLSGRVFARVQKSDQRRFTVETTFGTASALGTAYAVERTQTAMIVSVVESKVRVCAKPTDCQDLSPGERAQVTRAGITRLPSANPATLASWSSGWIEALDADLAGVLDELNRYRTQPVAFDRKALQGKRVSGLFPIRNPGAALQGIARSSGTTLKRASDGRTRIVATP